MRGFQNFAERAAGRSDDIMPWKRLGPHWHLSRRGFPLGKPAVWKASLLEQLCQLLQHTAGPDASFHWSHQQLVHLTVADQRQPWATVFTKRPGSLDVHLHGPKSQFGMGRITQLGFEPELDAERADSDIVKLKFRNSADLRQGDLPQFLRQHLEGIQGRQR